MFVNSACKHVGTSELSRWDGLDEGSQHTFLMRNKKNYSSTPSYVELCVIDKINELKTKTQGMRNFKLVFNVQQTDITHFRLLGYFTDRKKMKTKI